MKKIFWIITFLIVTSSTIAQSNIGKTYSVISKRYTNTNEYKVVKTDDPDSPNEFFILVVNELSAPNNKHYFYFNKATNKCDLYTVVLGNWQQAAGIHSFLNGLYSYRKDKNNGEMQWYDPLNPTFKIIISSEDGEISVLYIKENMAN